MWYLLEVIKTLTELGFIRWLFDAEEKTVSMYFMAMRTFKATVGKYELSLIPEIFEEKNLFGRKRKKANILFQIKTSNGIEEIKERLDDDTFVYGNVIKLYKSVPSSVPSNLQKEFYQELTKLFRVRIM